MQLYCMLSRINNLIAQYKIDFLRNLKLHFLNMLRLNMFPTGHTFGVQDYAQVLNTCFYSVFSANTENKLLLNLYCIRNHSRQKQSMLSNQECLEKRQYRFKKSLKILKGQSESVYRRRTDNTMSKRKSRKGQTIIYKTYT